MPVSKHPVILYVDKLNESGTTIGIVNSSNKIAYNLQSLGISTLDLFSEKLNSDNEFHSMGTAGRFIYFCSISLEKHLYSMILIDCNNDEDVLNSILEEGMRDESIDKKNDIKNLFQQLEPVYERSYNKVKLIKGDPV